MPAPANIDSYIATFPKETQKLLQQMRQVIQKAAPQAEEAISYAMPTFKLYGNLVHFAGYNHHIGFYPGAAGIANFQKEIAGYANSKGAVQFPLDKPLPIALITKIVKFRVEQNVVKAEAKKPSVGFMSSISAPARRALESKGIKTVKQLAKYSEADILSLHGIGATAIPKLKDALKQQGLAFKK